MSESFRLEPFAGALVNAAWSDRVVSGAYDSFSPAQRLAITTANPFSYLNVTKSPEDVPVGTSQDELLELCRTSLERIIDAGAFDEHDEAALFLYRLEKNGHRQTGIVGLAPMESYRNGQIGLHEGVRDARVSLLVAHSQTVKATSSPVALAFDASDEALSLIGQLTNRSPDLSLETEGVQQSIWRIVGDDARALADAASTPKAYITDGHHRGASAHAANEPGLLVALFPMTEMLVFEFNRLLGDRKGLDADAIVAALGTDFTVEESTDAVISPRPASFGMYVQQRWFTLQYSGTTGSRARSRLDVSVLQDHLLEPVFGVTNPGQEPSMQYVSGIVGIEALVQRCDACDGVAFVLHPTSVEELVAVSDEQDVMPPKSSYFAPKPQSGIFLFRTGQSG